MILLFCGKKGKIIYFTSVNWNSNSICAKNHGIWETWKLNFSWSCCKSDAAGCQSCGYMHIHLPHSGHSLPRWFHKFISYSSAQTMQWDEEWWTAPWGGWNAGCLAAKHWISWCKSSPGRNSGLTWRSPQTGPAMPTLNYIFPYVGLNSVERTGFLMTPRKVITAGLSKSYIDKVFTNRKWLSKTSFCIWLP